MEPPLPHQDADDDVVPAAIVADKRRLFGRKLGAFAFAILLLFFAIGGYVQSAKNANRLKRAASDRSKLIESLHHLSNTNDTQTKFIKQLEHAIRVQNRELAAAGYPVVPIPSASPSSYSGSSSKPQSNPNHKQNSHPKQTQKPKPKPSPTTTPRPPPDNTLTKVKKRICSLTGICTIAFPGFYSIF